MQAETDNPTALITRITVDDAVDLFAKYNVDQSAAAACAVHLGRAIALFRAARRLRLRALRGAPRSAHTNLNSDAFEAALALAYAPKMVIDRRGNSVRSGGEDFRARYTDVQDGSPLDVAWGIIDATLGTQYVVETTKALAILRRVFAAAGLPFKEGTAVGLIRGTARNGKQMRRLRSAVPQAWALRGTDDTLLLMLAIVTMASAMDAIHV